MRTTDPLNTNDIQTGPVIATTGLSPANAALATAFNIPSGHVQFFRLENPPVQGLPAGAARLRIQTSRPCQDFTPNVLDNGADPNIATNIVWYRETFDGLKFRNRSPYTQEVDSVRQTRFRYAVLSGGGQTSQDRFNVAMDADTFVHELGHSFGLAHWGRDEWALPQPASDTSQVQHDVPCLPNYRSVMDYDHDPSTPRFALEEGLTFNPIRSQAVVYESMAEST